MYPYGQTFRTYDRSTACIVSHEVHALLPTTREAVRRWHVGMGLVLPFIRCARRLTRACAAVLVPCITGNEFYSNTRGVGSGRDQPSPSP